VAPLKIKRAEAKKLYDQLASTGKYGCGFFGKDAIELILFNEFDYILDIGCGTNVFAKTLREKGIQAYGVDISNPKADFIAPAHKLPFEDEGYNWITSFDMLEHLFPGEIDEVLTEFERIARRGFIFSICYGPSKIDRRLHPTNKPEEWWIAKLSDYIKVNKWGRYLWGYLNTLEGESGCT